MNDSFVADREQVEYHAETGTYRVGFSNETFPPSEAVVAAVAAAADRGPLELDPLHDAIDPDALNALFQPTAVSGHRGDGTVTFAYHGYEVTVRSYGVVAVDPEATVSDRRERASA